MLDLIPISRQLYIFKKSFNFARRSQDGRHWHIFISSIQQVLHQAMLSIRMETIKLIFLVNGPLSVAVMLHILNLALMITKQWQKEDFTMESGLIQSLQELIAFMAQQVLKRSLRTKLLLN